MSIKDVKEASKEKKRKKDYLVSHEAEHVAQQICVWDQELFRRLRASEFLAAKWTKDDRKRLAPNIHGAPPRPPRGLHRTHPPPSQS